jgi:hypothetical protein
MSDEIEVIDDVFPPRLFEQLAQFAVRAEQAHTTRTIRRPRWNRLVNGLGPSLHAGVPAGAGERWCESLVATGPDNLADISCLLEGVQALPALCEAWTLLSALPRLDNNIPVACAYACGIENDIDAGHPHPGERVSVYINDRWSPAWGGETVFLGERGEVIKSVQPRSNRAVLFPADGRRLGRRVSDKSAQPLRTLTFRTRRRESRDFEDLSQFLYRNGAMDCPHYVGTLHDHLLRTFRALEARGCRREICLGGGLHAVYGTSLLRHSMLQHSNRALVRDRFGEAAENLAYLFSVLDRPRTLATPLQLDQETALVEPTDHQPPLALSRRDFEDLRRIECANLADQETLNDYPSLAALWEGAHP